MATIGRTGSIANKIVSPDLAKERANCAFDQKELEIMLYGGAEVYDKCMQFVKIQAKHPDELGNNFKFREMTITEKQTDLWRRIRFVHQNYPELFLNDKIYEYPYHSWFEYIQGLMPGVGLNYSMFTSVIHVMGNEEQRAYWEPLLQSHKILGCYAQTELGHGSNVAALETTATLDKATDEFVIHSPTTTSTKFWPGDLGRYSSHAVVFARLKIDGKDYGVHAFIMQVRDLNTWKHCQGVRSGDIGPKFGYQTKDNGWAIFDHVRVPRTNMLMNMAHVSKEGKFKIIGDMRALYSTMMLIRTRIINEMNQVMFSSLTMALRYASVRR